MPLSKKSFSLKKQFYTICFLMIISILSAILVERIIESAHSELDAATNERFIANQLANEFKQTIDDLHNTLHDYVTFDDTEYANKYSEIKLIVNGTNPRPENYNELYRNMQTDIGFQKLNLDPNKSLLFHIKNSGISEESLSIILDATEDYGTLLILQDQIIQNVKNNHAFAIELLASENYQQQMRRVLDSIVNFTSFQEQKLQSVISEFNDKQNFYENFQTFLILLNVLFIMTVIFLVNKYVVNPITTISQQLKSVSLDKEKIPEKNMGELVDLTHEVIEELKHKTDEQKRSKEKTKKLENSLLEAQRISNIGNWEHNIAEDTLYWSDEFFRICGLEPQSFKPNLDRFLEIIHPDDFPYVMKKFEETIAKRNSEIELEYRIVRPSGEMRHIKIQGEATYDKDNNPAIMQGVFHDVTEQVLRELESQKLQTRLIEAQRIGGFGHWNWNVVDNSVYWSDQIYKIYEYEIGKVEPSYDNFRKILHPEDAEKLDIATEKALKDGKPFQVEHRLQLLSGEIKTVIQRAELVHKEDGTPKFMNGTIQDITELKKAEEIARDAEANLVKIFDVAPAAIITTNHKMEINIFNQSAVNIFGFQQKEIIGKHINMLIPHEYRKTHHEKIDEFNKSGVKSRYMNERTGITGLKKDGSTFPAAASVSHTGKGENKIYTVILLDTTERMIIEKERVQAMTEAQEANKAKSQFLATMSHELRTPLNAIIGFSEMMTNKIFGNLGSSRYEEYANDIVGSSRHLLDLVNDILDLSEIESGKKKMDITHIPLRETVDECQVIITKLADDKNINTTFNIPDDMPLINADQLSLKQIIINIMNNAVKFTHPGGNITLDATLDEKNHIITIEDNGEGIPASKIHDVLNPFSRVDNDPYKSQEGKGLGLAIVNSLMALHNGTINIESKYGKGTKVILKFPSKNIR